VTRLVIFAVAFLFVWLIERRRSEVFRTITRHHHELCHALATVVDSMQYGNARSEATEMVEQLLDRQIREITAATRPLFPISLSNKPSHNVQS
jgi:Flp pilus assembly protein TadB